MIFSIRKFIKYIAIIFIAILSTHALALTPKSGIWWNPSESGRGYSIDVSGNTLVMAIYAYDRSGAPQWYTAASTLTNNGTTWQGVLKKYANGPCMGCAFSPSQEVGDDGIISVTFSSETTGVMTMPNGSKVNIQTFFGSTSAPTTAINPKKGIWWNPSESGRGYSIDVNGDILVMAVYAYKTDGSVQWYVATGPLLANGAQWQGTLIKYSNGPCMDCTFNQSQEVGNDGVVSLEFSSDTSAVMTMPNGTKTNIQSFFQPPSDATSEFFPNGGFELGSQPIACNTRYYGDWWKCENELLDKKDNFFYGNRSVVDTFYTVSYSGSTNVSTMPLSPKTGKYMMVMNDSGLTSNLISAPTATRLSLDYNKIMYIPKGNWFAGFSICFFDNENIPGSECINKASKAYVYVKEYNQDNIPPLYPAHSDSKFDKPELSNVAILQTGWQSIDVALPANINKNKMYMIIYSGFGPAYDPTLIDNIRIY